MEIISKPVSKINSTNNITTAKEVKESNFDRTTTLSMPILEQNSRVSLDENWKDLNSKSFKNVKK